MSLFGTSGIRDLCPKIVSPSLIMRMSAFLCESKKQVAIAYDSRQSGQMLKSAAIAGATQAGANVFDLGVCPTPTLSLYSYEKKCPAIMITASHNPYEYNGAKLFDCGIELADKFQSKIESRLLRLDKPPSISWNLCGQTFDVHQDAISLHIKLIKKMCDVNLIRKFCPSVLVDCANMAASEISPSVFSECGCKVLKLNCESGKICPRPLEPKAENLVELCKKTVQFRCDMAIAHDGDADRAVIIDEKGNLLGLDQQLAIATTYFLEKNPRSAIVSTVESSLSLRSVAEKFGADLIITPVGSSKVASKMREHNAVFGGEPCGEYIFKDAVLSPDGIMTAVLFAQIVSKGEKLSKLAKEIPSYPIKRSKIECKNEFKQNAMKLIEKSWPFCTPNKSDGLRSDEIWGWVLVRPSGTEPYIRITMEAKDDTQLKKNFSIIEELVKSSCLAH